MHRNTLCLAVPPRAPHVYLHVQVACTAAPPASLDTHTARSLPSRPEHTHQATSGFSVNSADFGLSGGRGLFIGNINQSGTSRVAARVYVRIAPDACAATPRAPHGWLHVSVSCRMTPHPLPVWMHGLAPCKETPRPPHVWPHGSVAFIATPRAWPNHLVLHMSSCMYRLHVLQHLMLLLTHIPSRACHHVLNTYTSSRLELLGPFV
ncbi:hypothetical protein DY000_02031507 [Brassica cretica]|uniref:Uncharacterized protein n=1 Tax=Brassica cretica TaxID=69181 RepID=A0ABQ7DU23_BRACR|nr:hypothetical protein DY000_02031507 [Brassica cretica]